MDKLKLISLKEEIMQIKQYYGDYGLNGVNVERLLEITEILLENFSDM